MSQEIDVDVAIIGGGVAGCLLAIALGEAGLSVALLEKRERLPFNGGDFLKPPGLEALARYGLDGPLRDIGLKRGLIRYLHDGQQLFDYDYAAHTQLGHYLIVPYATLVDTLVERIATIETISIRTGVGAATAIWNGDRVETIELERGGSVRAAALVGADGTRSLLRAAIGGSEQPQACGHDLYMATFPLVDSVAALNRVNFSSSGWLVYLYPLDQQRFRFAVSAPVEPGAALFGGSVPDFTAYLRTFVAQSDDALAAVDSLDGFVRVPVASLHTSRYSRGNAVLLGDAAHFGHPITGLGMNLALADAVTLGNALISWSAGELSLAAALDRYQQDRWPINEEVVRYGRELLRGFNDLEYYLGRFDPALQGGAKVLPARA